MKEHYVELYVFAESEEELKEILRTIVREPGKSGSSFAAMVDGKNIDVTR